MASIDQCKDLCAHFVRSCLSTISKDTTGIPPMPKFRAETTSEPNSYRFIEETQPNWWQLAKRIRHKLLSSGEGRDLAKSLEKTPPFSHSVGRKIVFPELGKGLNYASADKVALEILVSYLFSAGLDRWKTNAFDQVWGDCVTHFDPEHTTVKYLLYAPISYMPSVPRRLNLGNGLEIRRLRVDKIAQIASIDPVLAGVKVDHTIPRVTLWPTCFFMKQYKFKKLCVNTESHDWINKGEGIEVSSLLNEEVAILRSLLNETPAVSTYAFLRVAYPRVKGGQLMTDLPWRARLPRWEKPPTHREVEKYAIRRKRFLKLYGKSGWEIVAASMRRFAVAWENSFRSDILADIVTALEHVVVRDNVEVSYKLRTRVAHFLTKSTAERQAIAKNLNDAYSYRSKTFHGGYVFDNAGEGHTASRLKRAKGKLGNPFHDVNEVHRLIYEVAKYYRRILEIMIDQNQIEINWTALGL